MSVPSSWCFEDEVDKGCFGNKCVRSWDHLINGNNGMFGGGFTCSVGCGSVDCGVGCGVCSSVGGCVGCCLGFCLFSFC